jgi:predicted TIM-barrel fold metal-dependent hydrolase
MSGRIADCPVVDTETHVFVRSWPIETNPHFSPVDPFTRTAHSGELLVAELDRAGVDRAILIGYDGYDFPQFMARFRSAPADFMGGRAYTKSWADRFPERLLYVTTLFHPRAPDWAASLVGELEAGALGVKIFPAYLRLAPDSAEIRAVFDLLRERGRAAVFGFEDTCPPQTPSLAEYYEAIGRIASDYPDVPIQLNHGANALPGGDEFPVLGRVVGESPSVLVSTSVLGGPLMEWEDGWRYPFPTYLARLARYADALPSEQLAWATDWPWFEGWVKYPQLLQAVVDHGSFPSEEARRLYLGANAIRHWRLHGGA